MLIYEQMQVKLGRTGEGLAHLCSSTNLHLPPERPNLDFVLAAQVSVIAGPLEKIAICQPEACNPPTVLKGPIFKVELVFSWVQSVVH